MPPSSPFSLPPCLPPRLYRHLSVSCLPPASTEDDDAAAGQGEDGDAEDDDDGFPLLKGGCVLALGSPSASLTTCSLPARLLACLPVPTAEAVDAAQAEAPAAGADLASQASSAGQAGAALDEQADEPEIAEIDESMVPEVFGFRAIPRKVSPAARAACSLHSLFPCSHPRAAGRDPQAGAA